MVEERVKVGDLVWWTPMRGRPAEPVRIRFIDACSQPGVKDGIPVSAVYANELWSCCVSLENGRWAFGYDVTPLTATEAASIDELEEAA